MLTYIHTHCFVHQTRLLCIYIYTHTSIHKCIYMYTHPCIRTPYIYIYMHSYSHTHAAGGCRSTGRRVVDTRVLRRGGGRHASVLSSSSLVPPMAARPPLIPLLPLGSSGSLWAVQASVWRPLRKLVPDQWKQWPVQPFKTFPSSPSITHIYNRETPMRRSASYLRARYSSQIIASSLLPTTPVHPIFPSNRPSPVRSECVGSRKSERPTVALTTHTCD